MDTNKISANFIEWMDIDTSKQINELKEQNDLLNKKITDLDNYIFYSNNDCDKLMCELSSRDTLIIDLHITIESKNKIIDNLNLELKTFEKNYEELDQKYNAICIQQLDVANGLKKMVESIKKHSIENDYFEKINETYTQQSDEFNKIQQIFDMDIKDEIRKNKLAMRTYKKTKATAKNAEISAITSSFIEFLVAVKMSKDPIVEFLIFIAATMGVFVTAITVTIMMFYLLAVITCSIGDAVMFAMNGIIATGISITVLYDVSKKDEIIVLNAIKEICMSYGSLIMIFIHFFILIR